MFLTPSLGNEEDHDAVQTLMIPFVNRHYCEPLLMNNNEPTQKAHASKRCRPFTWRTHRNSMPISSPNVYTQSQDGKTYHWEVQRAPADQFRLPPTVEDNQVYSPVNPNHFDLAYTINCRTLVYHQLFLMFWW